LKTGAFFTNFWEKENKTNYDLSMNIIRTFIILIFAIYAAVRGIEFVQHDSNPMILFGVCCLLLAVGLSYLSVRSLFQKK
jgi:hypothetical protein